MVTARQVPVVAVRRRKIPRRPVRQRPGGCPVDRLGLTEALGHAGSRRERAVCGGQLIPLGSPLELLLAEERAGVRRDGRGTELPTRGPNRGSVPRNTPDDRSNASQSALVLACVRVLPLPTLIREWLVNRCSRCTSSPLAACSWRSRDTTPVTALIRCRCRAKCDARIHQRYAAIGPLGARSRTQRHRRWLSTDATETTAVSETPQHGHPGMRTTWCFRSRSVATSTVTSAARWAGPVTFGRNSDSSVT